MGKREKGHPFVGLGSKLHPERTHKPFMVAKTVMLKATKGNIGTRNFRTPNLGLLCPPTTFQGVPYFKTWPKG